MDEKFSLLEKYNLWNGNNPELGYLRTDYSRKLEKLTGNRLVKVLIGQRRVGKSYILRQLAVALTKQGVDRKNIFILSKEFEDFDFVSTSKDLNELFNLYLENIKPEGKVYIFLDEVQNIENWERFVNSYSQDYMHEYELFVTGSNSKMLSGELATLLSGRYVEIEVDPFSYDEFLGFFNKERGRSSYAEYIHTSGLPEIYKLQDDEMRRYYIRSLKDTILLRDIVKRHKVRDVTLLEDLFVYVINNASNLMSVANAVNYMKHQGRRVAYDTAATFLGYLEDAFLIFHTSRYNIRGKALIGGNAKYYANDLAFRNYLYRGFGYGDGYLLENAVYMELRRLGYDNYVGYTDDKEVDFVGIKADRKVYVQVAYGIGDEATAKREYASLEAINDSYEKYVVCMDDYTLPNNNGIRNIQAWNLGEILR